MICGMQSKTPSDICHDLLVRSVTTHAVVRGEREREREMCSCQLRERIESHVLPYMHAHSLPADETLYDHVKKVGEKRE